MQSLAKRRKQREERKAGEDAPKPVTDEKTQFVNGNTSLPALLAHSAEMDEALRDEQDGRTSMKASTKSARTEANAKKDAEAMASAMPTETQRQGAQPSANLVAEALGDSAKKSEEQKTELGKNEGQQGADADGKTADAKSGTKPKGAAAKWSPNA